MSFTPGAGTRFLVSTGASGTTPLSGPLSITGGTATTNTPVLSATQTWNNAAVTFTGWQLNVTDTASNANSLLMDLQVGGVSRFSVTKTGFLRIPAISGSSGLTFDASLSRLTLDTDGTGGLFRILAYGSTVGEIRTPAPYTDFWFNVPTGNAFAWAINNAERMRLDSSGNLGLGVGPSAWFSTRRVIQIGQSGSLAASTNSQVLDLGSNALLDSAGNFKYIATGFASYYRQFDSVHSWHVAPSGTAGNAISFTQAMTLDASGNLGVGTTSTTSGRLTVDGNSGAPSLLLRNSSTNNPYLSFQSGGFIQDHAGNGSLRIRATSSAGYLDFDTNSAQRLRIDEFGNLIVGTAALATTATNGFFYVAGCDGTPTGTPTAYTGRVPIVVDTTNHKLYFYSGGAWRDAGP